MKKTNLFGVAVTAFLLVCTALFFSCNNPSGGGGGGGGGGGTTYIVTIDPLISGGTVTANPKKGKAGDTITLTVNGTLIEGSLQVEKDGGGSPIIPGGSGDTYTFKMPADDVTVKAQFSGSGAEYAINIPTTITGGTVTSSAAKQTAGAQVTLTVTPTAPNISYTVTVTNSTTNAVVIEETKTPTISSGIVTFTMPASNVSVTATFTTQAYTTYSITCTPVSGGSVTASAANAVPGTEITLTVTTNGSDWTFSNISAAYGATNLPLTLTTVTAGSSYTFPMPAANVTITASFTFNAPEGFVYMDGELAVAGVAYLGYDQGQQVSVDGIVTGNKHNNHSKAIQLGPTWGLYGGGFALSTGEYVDPITISDYTALSLWIMSPSAGGVKIGSMTVGTDTLWETRYAIIYSGETGLGFTATDTWTEILIPIPKGITGTFDGVLTMWLENQDGKTLYIDDIRFIRDTSSFSVAMPTQANVPLITVSSSIPMKELLGNMKLVYTIGGKTATLFNKNITFDTWFTPTFTVTGQASSTGAKMENALLTTTAQKGGSFEVTVGFDGKTANETYLISSKDIVIIDTFTSGATHIAGDQGDFVGDFNGGRFGWGQIDANGYYGGGNIDDVRITEKENVPCFSFSANSGTYGGAVSGRVIDGTSLVSWDLSQSEYITFSYYTTTAGNSAVFGLRSGTVERDTANWPSTFRVNFTVLNAWTEVKITKQQLGGTVNWAAVNGWRFFTGGLGLPGHGGGTVFISDMAAVKD